VPTDDETDHRREFLRSWLPSGSEVRVEHVDPTVFDGSYTNGNNGHDHDHSHGHDHDHSHGHDHDHSHGHGTDLTLDQVRRAAGGGEKYE
jgi:ABC-type Zn2+ transport system substrate-binding protein/surface adhesin